MNSLNTRVLSDEDSGANADDGTKPISSEESRRICTDIAKQADRLKALLIASGVAPFFIDDIVQDALVYAISHRHEFRGGSIDAWLSVIAVNVWRATNLKRARQSVNLQKYGEYRRISSSELAAVGSEDCPMMNALRVCLDSLPEDRAALLHMKYGTLYKIEQIAEKLGKSKGWVRTRLHRTRLALRNEIRKRLNQPVENAADSVARGFGSDDPYQE